MQMELAYCLHEAGRYAQARALNEATLAAQMKRSGAESAALLPVLNNLAQNEYELKDDAAAEATLQRMLAIATAAGDGEHADSALMQLGALSFETGHGEQAAGVPAAPGQAGGGRARPAPGGTGAGRPCGAGGPDEGGGAVTGGTAQPA